MNFRGAAKRLEDLDLPRIGHAIGVGEDEIHAVIDVESSGSGFDGQGRPKMLFEPHVFWRNLSGAKRAAAVAQGLAYPNWKPGAYPKDSYPRLLQAMKIDETAALKAASWGLGQILGENHRKAGYATVQDMVAAFVEDEDAHLAAMVAFIKATGLADELRRHDWAGFARGYNGARYADHGYHTRLAAAYAKWARIRNTPWSPGQEAPAAPKPAPVAKPAPEPKPAVTAPAQPSAPSPTPAQAPGKVPDTAPKPPTPPLPPKPAPALVPQPAPQGGLSRLWAALAGLLRRA